MSELVFGQPWHGTYSAAGLTLEDATLRADFIPPYYPTDTHYVNFGAPPAPTPTAFEASIGMVWKNDVILCGVNKEYGVTSGLTIGPNGWLYRAADGTVFHMVCVYTLSTGVGAIYAGRLRSGTNAKILDFTAPIDPAHAGGVENYFEINQSPAGDRALLSIGRLASSERSDNRTYEFADHFNTHIEFTLTGGSLTTYPSCSQSVLYDYTTVHASTLWNSPDNHASPPGVTDSHVEFTYTYVNVLKAGYSIAGTRTVIAERHTQHKLFVDLGPDTFNYHFDHYYTWLSEIMVNGASVYSAPAVETHRVGDIERVPSPDYPYFTDVITLTTDISNNVAWDIKVFIPRHLSNCLIAMALDVGGAYQIQQVRSFDGVVSSALDGATFGGTDLDTVTLAAYNYRTGALASGLDAGFI